MTGDASSLRPRLLTILAGIALTVFFYAPVTGVMDTSLDASNFSSYTYFAAHSLQYGTEVVPMFGPFGYVIYGSVYNGLLFWSRLITQLIASAALAALVLWFFRQARTSPLRWLWLGLMLLLTPFIIDLPFEWMILLSGLLLLQRPPHAVVLPWIVLVATLLAFVTLIKGTHLILSAATLVVVIGTHAWFRDWRRVAWMCGSYVVAFLGFWLIAGQDPRNIIAFLRGVVALTSGYNEAMALDETPATFWRGVFALTILLAAGAWGLWHRRKSATAVAAALLFFGFTFVKWKHGFVRADGHVLIFHHYAAVAAVAWFLVYFAIHREPNESPRVRTVALVLMFAGVVGGLAVGGARTSVQHPLWLAGNWSVQRGALIFQQLFRPVHAKAELDRQLAEQRQQHALPLIRQEVGEKPIDLFGLQHGVIPLNGLNYRPRPMGGGSFNAYNPYLMKLNQAFIRDFARRPEYYLMRLETIDDRLATQDDGLALLEILHRYIPIRNERHHLLMQETLRRGTMELTPIGRQTFTFGERVSVPPVDDSQLLLARFEISLNWKGKLRSALYKPPLLSVSLETDEMENPETRRLVPSMAASPFLFSPAIETNADFIHLYDRSPGRTVTAFTLLTRNPSLYERAMNVEFFTAPRPTPIRAPDAQELIDVERHALFNIAPDSIEADDPRPRHLDDHPIQSLHAPGQISWTLQGSEHELVFDHGFLPEAIERGAGEGNGVVLVVELYPPGAAEPQVLLTRAVDPFGRPEDRRVLTSRIPIPPHVPGSRLVLRVDPGPHGNNAWDWSYVTRVQLKRGFAPPGFPIRINRAPVALAGSAPHPSVLDGERVTLLHVPGAMTFPLTSSDRTISLEFGFLPGAYQGGGNTPGADFVVEQLSPGQPTRELFRRTLRPVSDPAARDPQSATVSLSSPADLDQLRVSTQPVPGGNESWGWTYFSRLIID